MLQAESPRSELNPSKLAKKIKALGAGLGVKAVAVSDLDLDRAGEHLRAWLNRGYHGTMDYMARHAGKRIQPDELVPGTLRVISVRMDYLPPGARDSWEVLRDTRRAYLSRYALGRDYHK